MSEEMDFTARPVHRKVMVTVPSGIALGVLSLVLLAAVAAPLLTPHDPISGSLSNSLTPPAWMNGGSWDHPLGTDRAGRDLWARTVYGLRMSIGIVALCLGLIAVIAIPAAVVAGYFGRFTGGAIVRILETSLAVPGIMVALVLAVTFGPSLRNVVFIVLITQVARIALPLRADVISIRQRQFVILAETADASHLRIMLRHILPHVSDTAVVLLTLEVGQIILLEAALSFLGVGVPPPLPSLGAIIAEGMPFILRAPWIVLFPGLVLTLIIVSANVIGDWLRDGWDPRVNEGFR